MLYNRDKSTMKFSIIVACDRSRGIGNNGNLP